MSQVTPVEAVPLNTIILARQTGTDAKGNPIMKRIVPEIGKRFAFHPDEITQITKAQKTHVFDMIREPTTDTKGRASVATATPKPPVTTDRAPATANAPVKETESEL